jgi:hypothetical protein
MWLTIVLGGDDNWLKIFVTQYLTRETHVSSQIGQKCAETPKQKG